LTNATFAALEIIGFFCSLFNKIFPPVLGGYLPILKLAALPISVELETNVGVDQHKINH
jgi:hypothetical protein